MVVGPHAALWQECSAAHYYGVTHNVVYYNVEQCDACCTACSMHHTVFFAALYKTIQQDRIRSLELQVI